MVIRGKDGLVPLVRVQTSVQVASDGDLMVAPDAARYEGRDHYDREEEDEANEESQDLLVS